MLRPAGWGLEAVTGLDPCQRKVVEDPHPLVGMKREGSTHEKKTRKARKTFALRIHGKFAPGEFERADSAVNTLSASSPKLRPGLSSPVMTLPDFDKSPRPGQQGSLGGEPVGQSAHHRSRNSKLSRVRALLAIDVALHSIRTRTFRPVEILVVRLQDEELRGRKHVFSS